MKSIMEEASTIAKAISKSWERAGKPASFSVKVLEEPQTNFFGMTVKPAKIALFFEVKEKFTPKSRIHRRTSAPAKKIEKMEPERKPREIKREERVARPLKETSTTSQQQTQNTWTDEMVDFAKTWLNTILSAKKSLNSEFETSIDNHRLIITFEKPLTGDYNQDQFAFNSLGHLITKTVRTYFRERSQGLRISIRSNE